MNILLLNGSPHPQGNTSAMAFAFAKGAIKAAHQVKMIQTAQKKISGCLGCGYCRGKGAGKCIQHDDMDEIYRAMEQAQMLVLAAPIYFYTLCSQLQTVLHRTYALGPLPVKKAALLLSAGEENAFDAAVCQYLHILKYYGITDAGIYTLAGKSRQDPLELKKIEEFAENL